MLGMVRPNVDPAFKMDICTKNIEMKTTWRQSRTGTDGVETKLRRKTMQIYPELQIEVYGKRLVSFSPKSPREASAHMGT